MANENSLLPPKGRLLCLDIGNTTISIALSCGGMIQKVWRIMTVPHRAQDEYSLILRLLVETAKLQSPDSAVVSSVVPQLTERLLGAVKETFGVEPLNVTRDLKTGLTYEVQNPHETGVDRIVNAAAANRLYDGALIVIDLGTATTFCALSEHGAYLGGPIMPGPQMLAAFMAEKTAKLPLVSLRHTDKIIGSSTEENILAGLVFGQAGAVERIVYEMKARLNCPVTTVVTGGWAHLMAKPLVSCVDIVNPTLTFEGLGLIYALNTQG